MQSEESREKGSGLLAVLITEKKLGISAEFCLLSATVEKF